jgi:hypothetical protein
MIKLTKKMRNPNHTGNTHNEVDLLSILNLMEEIRNENFKSITHEERWKPI